MKRLYIILIVLLISCSENEQTKLIVEDIPDDPLLTILIKEYENINYQTLEFISESTGFDLSLIGNYKPKGEMLISFHNTSKNILDLFLIHELSDKLSYKLLDSVSYGGKNIYIDKNSNFLTQKNNFLYLSKNKLLIENVIRNSTYSSNIEFEKFQKLYENKSKNISLIVKENYDGLKFKDIPQNVEKFSEFMSYEFDILNDEINVLGFAESDQKRNIQLLNNLIKTKTDFLDIVPTNFSKLERISFEFTEIKKNLNSLIQDESIITYEIDSVYQNVSEIGELIIENDTLFLLNFTDAYQINLSESIIRNQFYRGQEIIELSKNNFQIDFFGFDKLNNFKYFTKFGNLVLFSKTENELENIILNFRNNLTLTRENEFKEFRKKIPSKSVNFTLYNDSNSEKFRNKYIYTSEEISNNLSYFSLFTSPNENTQSIRKLELVFKTKHSKEIVITPSLIKNHRTKDLNVFFQDSDNNIILSDLSGNKIWSKNFESKIISDVHQIDMYKNNRLQFIFLTLEYLYILDINGNVVKKVRNKVSGTEKYLSVFDYDKNKNYRLVVQEGRTVSMYDSKLNVIKGFKGTKTKKNIANSMDHIRILNKDFLIQYYDDKTFEIFDRRGRVRIKLPKGLKHESTVFKNQNKLLFLSEGNEIVKIDISGEVSYQPFTDKINNVASNQDLLVMLTENKLLVNENEFKIPYGNYVNPKIYKNYISLLNLDTKELYLFNKTKKVDRFPIFSSKFFDFSNKEKQIFLVLVGDENELLCYSID
ncbi:hypothetical protein OA490_02890 [Flavobacteriales bacterium]|nr:hypothetical protein [Flavobacteriales bacterium]